MKVEQILPWLQVLPSNATLGHAVRSLIARFYTPTAGIEVEFRLADYTPSGVVALCEVTRSKTANVTQKCTTPEELTTYLNTWETPNAKS